MSVDPEAGTVPQTAQGAGRRPAFALLSVIAVGILVGTVTYWFTVPIVVGFWALDTPSLAAACLIGATVLALVLAFRPSPRSPSWPGRIGRWSWRVLVVVQTLLIWAGVGLLWFVGIVSPFSVRVLTPSSPTGCRVVVRETSFLFAGGGDVYLLPAGQFIATPIAGYSTDDGLQPVSEGRYDLSWQGTSAASDRVRWVRVLCPWKAASGTSGR